MRTETLTCPEWCVVEHEALSPGDGDLHETCCSTVIVDAIDGGAVTIAAGLFDVVGRGAEPPRVELTVDLRCTGHHGWSLSPDEAEDLAAALFTHAQSARRIGAAGGTGR